MKKRIRIKRPRTPKRRLHHAIEKILIAESISGHKCTAGSVTRKIMRTIHKLKNKK